MFFSLVQNIKFSKIDLFRESQMQKALFGSSAGQMFFFWMAIGKRRWVNKTRDSMFCKLYTAPAHGHGQPSRRLINHTNRGK